jgi:transglutaminase-like putative cysteine protease
MSSKFPIALTLVYLWGFLCLAFMTGFHPIALLLLPVAAAAFWLRERWPMSKMNGGIGIGASLLLTVLVSQTATDSGHLLGVGSLSFAIFAAGTLISFTVLRSTEETRLAIPGLCGFLLVACSMTTKIKLAAVVGLFGTLLLALALRERQGLKQSLRQLPPLLVMLALSLVLALAAKWSETRLAYLLNVFSVIPASGMRFPPSASLNSLQRSNYSDVVVLRVYGDVAPPYLVGRSFADFDDRSFWQWKPTKEEKHPTGTVSSPISKGASLQVYPNRADDLKPQLSSPVIVEFPDGGSGFTFYTPRYFSALATDLPRLHRYSDGLWQVLARDSFSGFYCLYPYVNGWVNQGPVEPLSDEDRARYLALPKTLTPEVARQAQEVAGAYPDPEEKANRITTYFQTQFEYGYDYPFESDRTALEEFLQKRPPAHCEFFATATALMLRAQGVPTRYINGFVVQERSFDDDYYVIRLKHAHAWVEAYLPGKGWTTIDPTPPGVLQSPEAQNSTMRGALEWLSNSWRQLLSWTRLSPLEMFESAKRFLTSRPPGDWLALLAVIGGIWGFRRWLGSRHHRPRKGPLEAPFLAGRHERLTPLLESLQNAITPSEWRRQAWETPSQWADRLHLSTLEPATASRTRVALERYGALRYGGSVAEAELASLQAELTELRRAFEGKSLEARERPQHKK